MLKNIYLFTVSSKWDLIFSDNVSDTIIPGPYVTAPPTKLTILDPLLDPHAASSKLIETFRAVPTHLAGLFPVLTGQGSG